MTRELKLALIVGFSLVLVVTVLVSDHFSRARKSQLAAPGTDSHLTGSQLAATPEAVLPANTPPEDQLPPTKNLAVNPETNPGVPGVTPGSGRTADTGKNAPAPEEIHQGGGNRDGSRLAGRDSSHSDPDEALIAKAEEMGWRPVRRDGELVFVPLIETAQKDAQSSGDAAGSGSAQPLSPEMVAKMKEQAKLAQTPKPSDLPRQNNLSPDPTYVVGKGEPLAKIAKKHYGSESYWKKLAAYNGLNAEGAVREGARIKVPPVEVLNGGARPATDSKTTGTRLATNTPAPKTSLPRNTPAPNVTPTTREPGKNETAKKPEASKPAKPEPREYVVAEGDTLGSIAKKMLGSSRRVDELLALNDIDDEDSVMAGTRLRLPPAN